MEKNTITMIDIFRSKWLKRKLGVASKLYFLSSPVKRESHIDNPSPAPDSVELWEKLVSTDKESLLRLGFRPWDKNENGDILMLFPVEWYDYIPEGFPIVNITDFDNRTIERKPFKPEDSRDQRLGLLSYGIIIKGDDNG